MTRILFIHHGSGIGGASINLRNLIMSLNTEEYDIHVLFLQHSEAINLFQLPQVTQHYYREFSNFFLHSEAKYYTIYKYHDIKMLIQIVHEYWFVNTYLAKAVLKRISPDIVQLNSLFLISWVRVLAKKGLPVVMHVQEPLAVGTFGIRKKMFQYVIRKYCSAIIAISKDNAERVGIPDKTTIIYNAIDVPISYQNRIKPVEPETIVFAYLGGASEIKGIHILYESIKMLNANCQILMCGYYDSLSIEKLQTFNKNPQVKMLGKVDDIWQVISIIDVMVFPSIVPHFARPVLEAAALHKPTIASNVDGMSEIINHGVTGILVEPGNAKKLAEAMNDLASRPEIIVQMGNKAYDTFIRDFNSLESMTKVTEIYTRLINKPA